jgi:hypothetical protein
MQGVLADGFQGGIGGGLPQVHTQVAVQAGDGLGVKQAAGAYAAFGQVEAAGANLGDGRAGHVGVVNDLFG